MPSLSHEIKTATAEPFDGNPVEEEGTIQDLKGGVRAESGDNVLAFLHQRDDHEEEPPTPTEEKALVRKIDWMLMPFMLCIYLLQYLDKTLINFAAVMGIRTDAHMTTEQFSHLALVFYVSYLALEPVHAYLMQRFPTGRYLGIMVTLWGVAVTTTAACKTYPALIVTRVLLGTFESCVAPCLMLITTMWYTVHEQPIRTGFWYCGTGTGTIIGGLVSFGFQHYEGSFRSWQIMFLVVGLVTVVFGLLAAVFLPNNPMTAARLSDREKYHAIERMRANQTGVENKTFKWAQCREGLLDPHAWLLCLTTIACNIPNGMISSFQATVIASFGFTSKQSALLSLGSGGVSLVSIVAASYLATHFNQRCWSFELLLAIGVVGSCLVAFLTTAHNGGRLAGIFLTNTIGAALPLLYSWAEANTAGHTKKVTMNAMLLMSFALGNIIGPLTFRNADAPDYIPAKIAVVVTTAFAMVVALFLRCLLVWENKKRDRLALVTHEVDIEFADRTDRLNPEFRYRL